jgi:hypothetical protein
LVARRSAWLKEVADGADKPVTRRRPLGSRTARSATAAKRSRVAGRGNWSLRGLEKEVSMTEQNQDNDKKEMRVMWIITAVIVLAILGMVGANMLTDPNWRQGYTSGAAAEGAK